MRWQLCVLGRSIAAGFGMGLGGICAVTAEPIVVHTALDREFAEPVLEAYSKRTGVSILPKLVVESTKTVGLTNLIITEAVRSRCALFWNHEIR